ncbi:hypothetical protein F4861DRAFT_544539 [Xylaria intraflava]|nr:hypothetical protein F4861DRAFT_544539 [Xylaria intraflava]
MILHFHDLSFLDLLLCSKSQGDESGGSASGGSASGPIRGSSCLLLASETAVFGRSLLVAADADRALLETGLSGGVGRGLSGGGPGDGGRVGGRDSVGDFTRGVAITLTGEDPTCETTGCSGNLGGNDTQIDDLRFDGGANTADGGRGNIGREFFRGSISGMGDNDVFGDVNAVVGVGGRNRIGGKYIDLSTDGCFAREASQEDLPKQASTSDNRRNEVPNSLLSSIAGSGSVEWS